MGTAASHQMTAALAQNGRAPVHCPRNPSATHPPSSPAPFSPLSSCGGSLPRRDSSFVPLCYRLSPGVCLCFVSFVSLSSRLRAGLYAPTASNMCGFPHTDSFVCCFRYTKLLEI